MYDIKAREKTHSASEKKEKERGSYFCIYEYGKNLLNSTNEHAFTETAISISNTEDFVEK